MNYQKTYLIQLPALALFTFAVAGCATSKVAQKTTPASTETASANSSEEPTVRNTILHTVPQLQAVHFDYDRSELGEVALATITENAKWLKSHNGLKIQVAGYCDQRGTEAYNIALGQRRARAVRQQYTYLGVSAGQIATISYGKEKPVCEESSETCWQQNRRAETLVAFPEDVSSADPNE